MKTASAKAKGRALQNKVVEWVGFVTGLDCGKDFPIESRPMGQSGPDIKLDKEAREIFPFAVECKSHKSWNMPSFITQAQKNARQVGLDWMLILERKGRGVQPKIDPVVVMDMDVFFNLLREKIIREKGGE